MVGITGSYSNESPVLTQGLWIGRILHCLQDARWWTIVIQLQIYSCRMTIVVLVSWANISCLIYTTSLLHSHAKLIFVLELAPKTPLQAPSDGYPG